VNFRWSVADRAVNRAARSRFIDASARLGLASRGLVHLVIGALGARMALGHGGRALGTRDAVFELGKIGTLPLAFLAIGLCGYGAWRLVQTIADTERKGRSLAGLLVRLGFLLNGAFYFALAPLAVRIAVGMQTDPRDPTRETARWLMGLPGGDWAVGVLGALLIYSAVAQILEAARAGFAEDFRGSALSPRGLYLWILIGRLSIGIRAILFAIMGGFLIRAALDRSPHEAKTLGESFAYLREQPYGPYFFGTMSLGILAFAAFSFVYARERRVAPEPSSCRVPRFRVGSAG
jgi:hypothetical protein